MVKNVPNCSSTTVRDAKSGRVVTVKGAGVLKGHITLKKDVDLTKPIASQAVNGFRRKSPKGANAAAKH